MRYGHDSTLPMHPVLEPIELVDALPEPFEPSASGASARLRELVRLLRVHRRLALMVFTFMLAAGTTLVLTRPSHYTASTILQLSRNSPIQLQLKDNVLNLDEFDRNVNGLSSFIATQVAVLRSRDLAERAIRAQRLATNPAFLDPADDAEPPGLGSVVASLPASVRPRGLDAAVADAAPALDPEVAVPPELLDRYERWLDVRDLRGTDLVQIDFTTPDPQLSATLAAAHTAAYLAAWKDAQLATDETAMSFLEAQLGRARARVESAEQARDDFAAAHPNVAVNQEHELIAKQIGELSTQVTQAHAERTKAQSRAEWLTEAKDEPLAYLFEDSPAVEKLRLALLDVEAERAALSGRLGPNHAQMQALAFQAGELAKQLRGEIGREVAASQARFQAARRQEDDVRRALGELEQHAIALRELGGRYATLASEVADARLLYDSLLKQKSETGVHSELAAQTTRIVQRPEVPQAASRPNRGLGVLLALLAALGAAVAAVVMRESLDRSVRSSAEVEGLLRLPTLAVIPNFALANGAALGSGNGPNSAVVARRRRELVVLHEPQSPVAETFRSLRTAILFTDGDRPPRIVLVASAGAGEGKTITALNLATTLADAGKRVLLLDVDLRAPGSHEVLGVANERGLADYLAGKGELRSLIREVGAPRIAFLPAGPLPPNPAELVGSDRMRLALADLQRDFDFIILDSPPVLPVTDAVVLARLADAVVLVVKGHGAPRALVRRARDQLAQTGARLIGVVVNNVDLEWAGLDSYRGYYGDERRAVVMHAEGRAA